MAERLEFTPGASWQFAPDALPDAGNRVRALLRARLVDEVSGEALRLPTRLTTPRADLTPRVASDGLVGLVGWPAQALPDLATSAVTLEMTASCEGYLTRTMSGTLGPVVGFPASFAANDLGDVALHRQGVSVSGRVVHNLAPTPLALAGATVQIDAVWSAVPPPFWVPPALAEAPNLVSLAPGLYAPRAVAANVSQRAMLLSATVKTLLAPIAAGQTLLRLSDRDGLAVGALLAIAFDDAERSELIQISAIQATLAADEPTWITLAHAVARSHRDGARCTAATPQPAAAVNALARGGLPGDPTVFLAAAPLMADGAMVEIDDGAAPPEYQRVARYATSTNADGYFRLPPIARVALLRLLVQHAAVADAHPVVSVDQTLGSTPLLVALE